ncbi:MAG: hypothetical protein RL268_168 [Pseudomonadota bacterium]|jgi:hypothetical protein
MKALDALDAIIARIRDALAHGFPADAHDFRLIEKVADAQAEMIERGLIE